jgi:excisionase family DNA binding protein
MDHQVVAASPDPDSGPTPTDQEVIDQVLVLVAGHHQRLLSHLRPDGATERAPTLAELRQGRFGHDLQRLAAVARGQLRESPQRVQAALEAVTQLLFWPAAADDYSVPRSFWDTDLGRLLAQAKFRAYAPVELVSISSAAQQLGVSRPTIYRWFDDRVLDSVRDERSGRTFALRSDIERRRQVAGELV